VTAAEAYDLTTRGGATDFQEVISTCEALGPYCLIGGLAVNCYVEPVYTLDADLVVIAGNLPTLSRLLGRHSSDLRIQFTTDDRYQSFPMRAETRLVFGLPVRVAALNDVVQGKLWAHGIRIAASASARRTNWI
jgi:hypothetical protein